MKTFADLKKKDFEHKCRCGRIVKTIKIKSQTPFTTYWREICPGCRLIPGSCKCPKVEVKKK